MRTKYTVAMFFLVVFAAGMYLLTSNHFGDGWQGEPTRKPTLVQLFSPKSTFVVEKVEGELLIDSGFRKVVVRDDKDRRHFAAFIISPKEVRLGDKVELLEVSYVHNDSGMLNRFFVVGRVKS